MRPSLLLSCLVVFALLGCQGLGWRGTDGKVVGAVSNENSTVDGQVATEGLPPAVTGPSVDGGVVLGPGERVGADGAGGRVPAGAGSIGPGCVGGGNGGPACGSPQRCELKQPKEIRIKLPPQKIVCESPCGSPKQGGPNQGGPNQGARVPAQEVLLVPRTVFVPYVAQTPTGPARVLNMQGAVPLIPPADNGPNSGAPGPKPPDEGTPSKGAEKPECPKTCVIQQSGVTCEDLDELNQRLDRLQCLVEQLCGPRPAPRRILGPK